MKVFKKNILNIKEKFYVADPPLLDIKKESNQRLNEIFNLDNVLLRNVEEGEEDINNVVAFNDNIKIENNENNENNFGENYINNFGEYEKPETLENNYKKQQERIKLLNEIQNNNILKNTKIIEKNDNLFYYDHRYPEEFVPVEFALNPDLFIKKYPTRYPSLKLLH